ncbi:VanW family protein [Cellulosimicrobium cellulans]|uniref:VanW family protein n=1 Tax=Cellulosimicrobium cellulans TaxID=1710 RepID=UPI003826B38E
MGQPTDRDADLDSPQDAVPGTGTPGPRPEPAPVDESAEASGTADVSERPGTDDGDVADEAGVLADSAPAVDDDAPRVGTAEVAAPGEVAAADEVSEPVTPVDQDTPAAGSGAAEPETPAEPVAPAEPATPAEPVAPAEPAAAAQPVAAAEPAAPHERADAPVDPDETAVIEVAEARPDLSEGAEGVVPQADAVPSAQAADAASTAADDAPDDAAQVPAPPGEPAAAAAGTAVGTEDGSAPDAAATEAAGAGTDDVPVADGAVEAPAADEASSAAPAPEARSAGSAPVAETDPSSTAPAGTVDPPSSPDEEDDGEEDEEEPYVPRVFAFDPSVPAVLVPAPGTEEQAATPSDGPDVAADDPAAEPTAVAPTVEEPEAERTAVVPVVPPQAPAPSPTAPDPAAADPTPAPAADATQVIPPVDPWSRPAPVVRTSVRPGAPATAPAADPTATPGATPAAAPSAAGLGSAFGPVPPDESRQASPFDGFEEDAPRRGWVRGLMWTGIGVLVLGGLYTGAQWFFSDKVPSGTSVAGVDVGGLTRTAAQDRLESELGPRAAEPVALTAGEASTTLDPAAAGLTFDAAATAEELTAFSMSPARLWQHLFGGEDEAPVVSVDDAALDAQVEALRGSLEIEPVDGTVQFVDGAPTSTPAADGSALVTDEVPAAITSSWLDTDGPVALPTEPVEPAITQEETDAALAQAEKVVSAPVVVSVGGQNPELPPEALAAAASFPATDGVLTLTFDGATLVDSVVDRTSDLLTAADDAHFVFQDGAPVIEGGEPGTTIDPAAIAAAVTTAASGDERTATVELVESDPEQSVAALEALGIKEKVSEFSTPVPNVPVRTANLRRGAEKVTGTLVKPGETFSLVDTLSPITLEGGYFAAGIVESGRHTEGVGGGLSQMATTTYNAGFFAGLEDVEHRPHSYWFERYPAGREATIFVGSIDMKFKNDTPYGVLMQSWVGGGELHVAIWSTKYYDVETSSSGKSNVVQPTTVTHSGADCAPTPAGSPGFSITNYRKVYHEGELVKDESYRWTYKPDNAVVCE